MKGASSRASEAVKVSLGVVAPSTSAVNTCSSVRVRPISVGGKSSQCRRRAAAGKGSTAATDPVRSPIRPGLGAANPSQARDASARWSGVTGTRREPGAQLIGRERAETDEGVESWIVVDADQRERWYRFNCCHPVEDLDELKLIVEVVFEPENDLACTPQLVKSPVSRLEVGQDTTVGCPAAACHPAHSHRSQRRRREPSGHRAFTEYVVPADDLSGTRRLDQRGSDDVAVRDVEQCGSGCDSGIDLLVT